MSKADELNSFKRMALKEVVEWLDLLGRVDDDFTGWYKFEFVQYLARKLSVEQVDALLEAYNRDGPEYFDQQVLVDIFGLPSKDTMLANATRDDLLAVMDVLEEAGACHITYRSRPKYELEEYLKNKLSSDELAQLLNWVGEDDDAEEGDEDEEDDDGELNEDEEGDENEDEDEEEAPPSSTAHHARDISELLRKLARRGGGG